MDFHEMLLKNEKGLASGPRPLRQISPRQSFMTKYVIKPFERGAYNRSLHRPAPLKGSTWGIETRSYPAHSSSKGSFPGQGQN